MLIRICRRKMTSQEAGFNSPSWKWVYDINAGPDHVGPRGLVTLSDAVAVAEGLASKIEPRPRIVYSWNPRSLFHPR
jgi:hypothetical protein